MIFKEDILNRINDEFNENAKEAKSILAKSLKETNYIDHDRIIRCIIYCSNKSIAGLRQSILIAKADPRDIMYKAEYIPGKNALESKRIRDFSNPFNKSKIDADV